jgi:indolepyruvate ferredoxin oxidoreductase
LAPPILANRDPRTGELKKKSYGPWMIWGFRVLARLKGLRGTSLDPFGRSEERRAERQLIADYESVVDGLLADLDGDNHELAVRIARIPESIRGFGHVKARNIAAAKANEENLLAHFRGERAEPLAAE